MPWNLTTLKVNKKNYCGGYFGHFKDFLVILSHILLSHYTVKWWRFSHFVPKRIISQHKLLLYATVKWGWFSNLTNLECFSEGNFAFRGAQISYFWASFWGSSLWTPEERERGRVKGRDGDVIEYATVLLAIVSLKWISATQSFLKRLDFHFAPFNLVSFSTWICWRDSHCGSCFLFNRRIPIKSIYHLTLV